MYSKNNEYKNKINLRCVLYKKDCFGTAYIEIGKFFNNQKHNHPKNFAEIEKTEIEARIKNESETSTLAPRDIHNKNINPENVDISTFTKISSIMRKKKSKQFPTYSLKSWGIWYFVEKPWFRDNWWQYLLQNIGLRQQWIRAIISGRYWFIVFE